MDWFLLTIILSFTGSTLVLSLRAITPETNPFLFMGIATGIAWAALTFFCLATGVSLALGGHATILAVLAGICITLLDIAFIFMFRKGATVSATMLIFRVSSIVLSAFIGFILFHETMNAVKLSGILLACIAVYLLNTKPKGE